MTLSAKLTAAFVVFAALPVTAALWPASRALSEALDAEYRARLDQAALAVEREYRRVARSAVASAQELARGAEVEALARERTLPGFEPAEAAARARPWMEARGLDVLAVMDADGVVLSSGHLPGRAGEADPDLRPVLAEPPGQPLPRTVARATPDGVEPALAVVAWEPVAAADPPLRAVAGVVMGATFADRVASLTGGEVRIAAPGSARAFGRSSGPRTAADVVSRLVGATRSRSREIPIPSTGAPAAVIEVALPSSGLARAQVTLAAVLLAALTLAIAAAAVLGHLVARRITRPLEALAAGARRVAAGELATRVDVPARGELRQLVDAFNGMTADLAATTARAASAERVAAWREVARRLAHEVKNPLTPVAMSVETLREAWARQRADFGEIFDEATRAIGEEVRRLARIVDEFGRFARLPAPVPERIAPDELIASALALYPERSGEVTLSREVEAGLPPVRVDRDQLLQVLHNLVRNALEAIGPRGSVRVSARRDGAEIAIAVADDGPGIAPADLGRVFEPYFTTKGAGTGLGLAVAERIVREHGGRLDVASRPGAGATFTVRLPIAP